MRPAASGKQETPAAENIDSILRLEKQDEKALAVHHRFFHWIGWFVGTIQFIALQCAFVFCWVVFNLYLTHQAFDEYPFPLLATILALEAVLLTSCVLIRQSSDRPDAGTARPPRTADQSSCRKGSDPVFADTCSGSRKDWTSTIRRIARRMNLHAKRRLTRSRAI